MTLVRKPPGILWLLSSPLVSRRLRGENAAWLLSYYFLLCFIVFKWNISNMQKRQRLPWHPRSHFPDLTSMNIFPYLLHILLLRNKNLTNITHAGEGSPIPSIPFFFSDFPPFPFPIPLPQLSKAGLNAAGFPGYDPRSSLPSLKGRQHM